MCWLLDLMWKYYSEFISVSLKLTRDLNWMAKIFIYIYQAYEKQNIKYNMKLVRKLLTKYSLLEPREQGSPLIMLWENYYSFLIKNGQACNHIKANKYFIYFLI